MRYPIEKVFDGRFVRVFDIKFAPGHHYYDVSRRDSDEIIVAKSIDEIQTLVPDAVSCVVILEPENGEPLLLLSQEYRYPIGQFVLSVPAGLIDPEDRKLGRDDAIRVTAIRELKEETGVTFKEGDELSVINPMLFSSPGITDENNAMVKMVIHNADLSELTQDGCEGAEQFDGFELVTVDQAKAILEAGKDSKGMYYSVYTWIALASFAL